MWWNVLKMPESKSLCTRHLHPAMAYQMNFQQRKQQNQAAVSVCTDKKAWRGDSVPLGTGVWVASGDIEAV